MLTQILTVEIKIVQIIQLKLRLKLHLMLTQFVEMILTGIRMALHVKSLEILSKHALQLRIVDVLVKINPRAKVTHAVDGLLEMVVIVVKLELVRFHPNRKFQKEFFSS